MEGGGPLGGGGGGIRCGLLREDNRRKGKELWPAEERAANVMREEEEEAVDAPRRHLA